MKLYNAFMGGVDLADNLRKYCDSSRKSKRWYMRLFWYGVEVSIVNSFTIWKETNGPELLKFFRLDLADEMIQKYCGRKEPGQRRTDLDERYVRRHFPIYHANTSNYCKAKCGTRPSYVCDKCKVFLCLDCFKKYLT